jgi:hypothetical protein
MNNYILMTLLPNFKNFMWFMLLLSSTIFFISLIPIVWDLVEGNNEFKCHYIYLKKAIKISAILALSCIIILVFIPTDANLALMVN